MQIKLEPVRRLTIPLDFTVPTPCIEAANRRTNWCWRKRYPLTFLDSTTLITLEMVAEMTESPHLLSDDVQRVFQRACREGDMEVAEHLMRALETLASRENDGKIVKHVS